MNQVPVSLSSQKKHSLAGISLIALGVVFGDIGTSPLYALRECFHGAYGIGATRENILGVLSLMFWALTIIVSIKYLMFVFRADNRGEGGVIALTALVQGLVTGSTKRRLLLIGLGVFAGCLLYGDGMITPAISVLSAVEGLGVIAPELQRYIIPVTLLILAALFMVQHRGTAQVGGLFGPVILVWFIVLGVLGVSQLVENPDVLRALSPVYGIQFLLTSGVTGFLVLGAVFLVVTGAEALYADLGHFGRKPIRVVWFALVFPSLLLNYLGQGALILAHPVEAHHPFYGLVPGWAVVPMVLLATSATIIASQALITGVFSITSQCIQMGYLPRLRIVHTSSRYFGQIYVPQANWLMMLATLALVVGFQSSSKLAAAYGVAVTTTMVITSLLFYVVAREKWGWNRLLAVLPFVLFIITDLSFFAAALTKILHGAWFPLVAGAAAMIVMMTWKRGREILGRQLSNMAIPFGMLKNQIAHDRVTRVRGTAVFLAGQPRTVPFALIHNLKHNKVLHSQVILLNFSATEVPRVPNADKLQIEELGGGFYQVVAFYGFMESPDINQVFDLAAGQGLKISLNETSFFLGREMLMVGQTGEMSRWRALLFAFLSRNAHDASAYFGIPANRVVEVGIRMTI